MKQATIDIKVTATVNGQEVQCELAETAKVIIDGNLVITNIQLQPE